MTIFAKLRPLAKLRPIAWLNAVLALPAGVSLYFGIRNAFVEGYSHDLQWSGAHLTFLHIDPYRQLLLGNPQHLLRTTQVPNYLQELYVLLLPLGMLSYGTANLIWVCLNCCFTLSVLLLLRQLYKLESAQTILLAFLLFASVPFRLAITSGTQSILELLLFCLVFYWSGTVGRGVPLGLSYCKYSFSPALFTFLFFRRRYLVLAVSFAAPALGLFLMWALVHGSFPTLAVEPFLVSRFGVAAGQGDLMTIIRVLGRSVASPLHADLAAYLAALLGSLVSGFLLARRPNSTDLAAAAPLAIASLMFFVHLTYDYIFLIVPLAACLGRPLRKTQLLTIAAISFLWFGTKLIARPTTSPAGRLVVEILTFALLTLMLALLSRRSAEPLKASTFVAA